LLNLTNLQIELSKIEGLVESDQRKLNKLEQERLDITKELSLLSEAINLAKVCTERSLEQRKYIEKLVTSSLIDVFGGNYEFVLDPVLDDEGIIKGLKPKIKEGDGNFDDPMTSFGAGMTAIISVCFKISLLLMVGGTAKLLILDESLANLNYRMQEKFQAFVENICSNTGLQLILVTHAENPFGKIISVSKDKKVSVVKEL
jgi:DNA repair exonuclease SbcCD ATPase subunit